MGVIKKPVKYEVPGWEYIHELCVELAEQVKRSKYNPDLIVAVSRGGWIPGRLILDFLGGPDIATIKVEYYVGFYKTRDKPEITQPLAVNVKGKKILLVDDIADTGRSLKVALEYLREQGAKEVKTAALYFKPWSLVVPDFYARKTDAWVCFPHETYESIDKMYSQLIKQGKSKKDVMKRLVELGIRPFHVEKFLSKKGPKRV
ncbi:MAG: phosphoribosyltransferase [Candidatus Hadarchaeum sp.]|uniref:phosphoribosyltransferase n=1 Tax=Candidatus Hadarchaeum sp. TaxID=2883567 RepID=UPI0031780D23